MKSKSHDDIRTAVRESYGKVAQQGGGGCSGSSNCCTSAPADVVALQLGYSVCWDSSQVRTEHDGSTASPERTEPDRAH